MMFSSSILKLNALAMWAPKTAFNEELGYEKGRQPRRPRDIPNANCYFSPRLEQYHQVSKSLQPSFLSDPSLHSI
jgi:hypothetical protein